MQRFTTVLQKARQAIHEGDLLKVLQSEIRHELSSDRFQNDESGCLGAFLVDWDSPHSQDVVFRKTCESGEEVAISALLSHRTSEDDSRFPVEALMKVCIKKPGLSSILQFDCGVSGKDGKGSNFHIHNANYIQSSSCLDSPVYKGPAFCTLDPHLQDELKQYLVARGIDESFTNFLLLHLYKKEQRQYVIWLRELEAIMAGN